MNLDISVKNYKFIYESYENLVTVCKRGRLIENFEEVIQSLRMFFSEESHVELLIKTYLDKGDLIFNESQFEDAKSEFFNWNKISVKSKILKYLPIYI